MIGPSSQISKFLLTLLILLVIYYLFMDYNLYIRIKNYPIDREFNGIIKKNSSSLIIIAEDDDDEYKDMTWIECKINPLCEVTVKAILTDHTNFYLLSPLVTIVDNIVKISCIPFITPNIISFFHVFVALLSAKCVSSDNLAYRRIGVVLFEFRTWLDDLDGHVARVRKHIKGDRSEIGTSGYYIDGICDALGTTALILGILIFFKNNPPRRGYIQLPTSSNSSSNSNSINNGSEIKDNLFSGKVIAMRKVVKKLGLFVIQLILSSAAWNRYIALYQNLIENLSSNNPLMEFEKQNVILTSSFFYAICWLWRIVNVHNMLHCVLLALFCDKLWDFLSYIQYFGFGILFSVICTTELHYIEAKSFIYAAVAYD